MNIATRRARTRTKDSMAEARALEQRRRGHGPDARQMFGLLRERMLASRPMLSPASVSEYPKTYWLVTFDKKTGEKVRKQRKYTQRVSHPPVFGKPTFKNVFDEKGQHV